MLKKLISGIIIVALLAGIMTAVSPLFTSKASAEEYRGGYHLSPLNFDSTGVRPDSNFIFKSQKDLDLDYVRKSISIDGEPIPIITLQNPRTFTISPARELEQNRLYTFRIKRDSAEDITWTFQTSAAFKIINVFPADKTASVPTNTGIEIYFSHEDFENIDKYFEITPSVPGTFERHKKAAVFVPKGLKESTLYTVTLKKGLKLNNSNYSLKEDYTFQFETAASASEQENTYKGFFTYNKSLNEYTPREKPYIPLNYYVNQEKYKEGTVKVQTIVYGYKDLNSFINALNKKDLVPIWAYMSYRKNLIQNTGLNKVLEFGQELAVNPAGEQFIKIPQALPAGYYLIDSKWEDLGFQTFIQVTDIGMYIMKSENKALVWLNDLSNNKPVKNATLSLLGDNSKIYKSDSNGIAFFDSPVDKSAKDEENMYFSPRKYLKIQTSDNKTALLNYYSYMYRYWGYRGVDNYWNYLQQDRNLYKPDDTVNFWGLVKNRYMNEDIKSLTVEISQGYMYFGRFEQKNDYGLHYFPMQGEPLIKQSIKVEGGILKGSVKLPFLEPGGYQLTVKKGSEIIANSYINVQNYVKPAYRLELTKDKEAIFTWEEASFGMKASFFEGTGVPGLAVNYSANGLLNGNSGSGSTVTDPKGTISVKYKYQPSVNDQGEVYGSFYASSQLPEMGEIAQNSSIRVFVNDINAAFTSQIKDNKGTITAAVNKIVLDRLNNGTAKDYSDYLGDPVSGKILSGTIYKNKWVKVEDGQYYDFINKVTQKVYRYELHTEAVQNFTMITGFDGKANLTFDAPNIQDGYYTAKVSCVDGNNRNMKFDLYFGGYYEYKYDYYYDNRYYLDGGKQSYKLGETVDLTFRKGKEKLPDGSFIFIKSQNGIREYELKSTPEYSFKLNEKDVPNIYVTGVYFNGTTYIESEIFNTAFDYSEKNLILEAHADKQAYKPGDEVVIKISAKDKSGAGKKAVINASIVDEALFSLNEQYVDTLASLYSGVPSGIDFTYQSHINSGSEVVDGRGSAGGMADEAAQSTKAPAPLANMKSKADTDSVRENFKDTACFETVMLDGNGHGELKFRLPDNITSWRVTLSAATTDLYGGSNKISLNVTLPFFINYTLNTTYLEGDKPVLGVNAYGNDLKQGDDVTFEITSSANKGKVVTASGKAFERVNIPLWKLGLGKDDITINAYTRDGLTDSVKHAVNVISSYHQVDKASYYDLKQGLVVKGGSTGNTRLIFSDKSRGAFLPDLTSLLYTSGNRIDQRLSVKIASRLIKEYFKQQDTGINDISLEASEYQAGDGGIALLPYGGSDADISAKLVTLIKDEINTGMLKNYFYNILYDDSPGLKGNVLYGLAVLKEPVLLNLDKAAAVENANIKDILYIALAYCELGETAKAEKLYNEKISGYMEEYKPYFRINTGKDKDDILESTSLASILASWLDKPEKEGLYEYCMENYTKDILINIEKLLYINREIDKTKNETVKFTYSLYGDKNTVELKNGESFTLDIPSVNLPQFKVNSVQGSVSVVSIFKEPVAGIGKTDSSITVDRKFYRHNKSSDSTTTFNQGDIVWVELSCSIGTKAFDGGYEVTDYLPSGLKPIETPWKYGLETGRQGFFNRIDGQKVTFYVYNDLKYDEAKSFGYYARVISSGTYKAEGTIIQSLTSKDSINVGKAEIIEIK